MTTDELDYLWQVIRDSERSDEFRFMTDEDRSKADPARLARQRHSQPEPAATSQLQRQLRPQPVKSAPNS